MLTLFDELKALLQQDARLVVNPHAGAGGELLKNQIIELALKLDRDLLIIALPPPPESAFLCGGAP